MEDGEELEDALARELREEIAGTTDIHSLVFVLEHGGVWQSIFLGRVRSWSSDSADRSGPEFDDPARGEYQLQIVALTAEAVSGINLKPEVLARFLLGHLHRGTDLFALPDLRAGRTAK